MCALKAVLGKNPRMARPPRGDTSLCAQFYETLFPRPLYYNGFGVFRKAVTHREMDRRITVRTISNRGIYNLGIGICGVIRDDACASHTI